MQIKALDRIQHLVLMLLKIEAPKPLSKLSKTRPSSTWQKASAETFQLTSHLTVKEWCSLLTSEPELGFALSLVLSIVLEGQASTNWKERSKVLICKWHNHLCEQVYGIDKKKVTRMNSIGELRQGGETLWYSTPLALEQWAAHTHSWISKVLKSQAHI